MNELIVKQIKEAFEKQYGSLKGAKVFFAPGRVNLIGEHVDYSGGMVFPCALEIGTYCIIRKRSDRKINFYSVNLAKDGVVSSTLDDLKPLTVHNWTQYPKGVIWALAKKGYVAPSGFDLVIGGDIPGGAGLSSSASLEVVMGVALRDIYGWSAEKLTNVDIALAGQTSENGFCGSHTGIMDQFASAMGKKGNAIILNCATLAYEYAPLNLKGKKIIVTNSNKPHSLVSSQYNVRRAQSDHARDQLKTKDPSIVNLCDISLKHFYEICDAITDPVEFKRAKHAISENERVKKSLVALKANDLYTFGDLVNEAGESIRYDYEATCEETDVLVDAARIQPGVLCSRQTGGGWGGCTVSIVDDAYVEAFEKNVEAIYASKTKYRPSFYVVSIGDGPSCIESL